MVTGLACQVRALRAPHGGQLKEVLPGQPAEIIGLRGMPQAGDALMVGDDSTRHPLAVHTL